MEEKENKKKRDLKEKTKEYFEKDLPSFKSIVEDLIRDMRNKSIKESIKESENIIGIWRQVLPKKRIKDR